jgi:hypothetical protein
VKVKNREAFGATKRPAGNSPGEPLERQVLLEDLLG